jgi:hypothetical protein
VRCADSSLHDVKMAVRASTLARSMIKTLARINDPLLNRAAADQGREPDLIGDNAMNALSSSSTFSAPIPSPAIRSP